MKKPQYQFDEENLRYLRGLLGDEKVDTFLAFGDEPDRGTSEDQKACETVKKCLEQMEKYGDNRWWLSKDKRVLGYYQLMEDYMLLHSFDEFKADLGFLLGHPVTTVDLYVNYEQLKAEAERAFKATQESE